MGEGGRKTREIQVPEAKSKREGSNCDKPEQHINHWIWQGAGHWRPTPFASFLWWFLTVQVLGSSKLLCSVLALDSLRCGWLQGQAVRLKTPPHPETEGWRPEFAPFIFICRFVAATLSKRQRSLFALLISKRTENVGGLKAKLWTPG